MVASGSLIEGGAVLAKPGEGRQPEWSHGSGCGHMDLEPTFPGF